jgi:hypothetical protein
MTKDNYFKQYYLERYTPKENLSTQWKDVYDVMMRLLEYRTNVDEIDGIKFVARFAIRRIQELKSCHMDMVDGHYYRIKIQKLMLESANKPEIIAHALKAKLSLEYKDYIQACENIISCELANAGYNIDETTVGLWGKYPGKYELAKNADKEYYKIDIFHPIPADGIPDRSGEFDINPEPIVKKKNKFSVLSKLSKKNNKAHWPILTCVLVDIKPNSSLMKCSVAIQNEEGLFDWQTIEVVTDFKLGECYICVPRNTFIDMMKLIGDEKFTITEDKTTMTMIVTGENFKNTIKGLDAMEFPKDGGAI